MKKIILFLSLLTYAYLSAKINYLDNCQIGKVKLSDSIKDPSLLQNLPELIPFSLKLKKAHANHELNCYIENSNSSKINSYCYVLSDFLEDLTTIKSSSINFYYTLINSHLFNKLKIKSLYFF
jgi:hypothetical protein